MRKQKPLLLLLFANLVLFAVGGHAQERYDSGDLRGFVKYSAFEIVQLDRPLKVHKIEGLVRRAGSSDPLLDVLVEIRDSNERIRATNTDSRGRFKFGSLPDGNYAFKITLNGFSSVVGIFELRNSSKQREAVKLEMPIGV